MCREVLRSTVGFGFDNAADTLDLAVVVHEVHADELASDLQYAARVKVAR
jgi:hypothetical protein